jgi:alpha-L-rhamnosidase
LKAKVLESLEKAIRVTDKGHINAGIHGHYFLIKTLLGEDRNDLIFTMVNQRTYPGWGAMLQQGATTIWEQWDGLNSHCHSSFLGVGLWFIQGLAGIRPDDNLPGFKHVVIRPAVVGDLTFSEAEFDSPYGTIRSGWRLDGDRLTLNVTIPPNTSATVYVPAKPAAQVSENGQPAEKAPGVRFVMRHPGAAVYEIGSGAYRFVSSRP